MEPNNPFLIAGYHSPAYFCDREVETTAILDALHNGRNVTLIAPRRMGKTGLMLLRSVGSVFATKPELWKRLRQVIPGLSKRHLWSFFSTAR